jgi:hypothetical protein
MGLLEQAQQQKQQIPSKTETEKELFIKKEQKNTSQDFPTGSGLLSKAKRKKQKPSLSKKDKDFAKNTRVLEEKKGFGWKGLGIRRIIKHTETGECFYQIIEPELTPFEKELKKEITHLFKMLADIDVTGTETAERKKYLEKTLEHIITDNDIKFYPTKKKKNTTDEKKQKTFKELFQFKKPKKDTEKNSENHQFFLSNL